MVVGYCSGAMLSNVKVNELETMAVDFDECDKFLGRDSVEAELCYEGRNARRAWRIDVLDPSMPKQATR